MALVVTVLALAYSVHVWLMSYKSLDKKDIELINLRTAARRVVNANVALLEASHESGGIKFIERDKLADLIYSFRMRTKDLRNEIDSGGESRDNGQKTGLVSP